MGKLGNPNNCWIVDNEHIDISRDQVGEFLSFSAQPKNVTVNINKSAVIIVDMQNDFCHSEGWLSSVGASISGIDNLFMKINYATKKFRDLDIPIVWLNWGNRADLLNLFPSILYVYDNDGSGNGLGKPASSLSTNVLQNKSWGSGIHNDLDVCESDIFVNKYRMSGFWDNELNSILRNLNVTTIFFMGVNIDQCVFATLMDASFLGYDCIMLEDACATSSPDYCITATLYNIRQCYGFTTTTDSVFTNYKGV